MLGPIIHALFYGATGGMLVWLYFHPPKDAEKLKDWVKYRPFCKWGGALLFVGAIWEIVDAVP